MTNGSGADWARLSPSNAVAAAFGYLGSGRVGEAAALCRAVLAQQPRDIGALQCLGMAVLQNGEADRAVAFLTQAVLGAPTNAALRTTLGVALNAAGRPADAVASYEAALRLAPGDGNTFYNLGNALRRLGRLRDAEAAYRRAIAAGNCRDSGAAAYANLGLVLEERDAFDEASLAHQEAIRRRPSFAEYHYNRGNALRARLALEAAVAAYDQALALRPDYAEAQFNRSLALLLLGDYERGWPDYEARLRTDEIERRGFAAPVWRGEPFAGQRLLLHAEQGHGDCIQCLRYLAAVAARGGAVALEVPPALRQLVDENVRLAGWGTVAVYSRGDSLPPFDLQASLMSLPGLFGARRAPGSDAVPYLQADPARVSDFQAKLGAPDALRIGLVWAGSPHHRNDRNRSLAPQELLPVLERHADAPPTRFYSLQFGGTPQALAAFPPGRVIDLAPDIADFADAAAAVVALDLIVCVDTALAHLAGALGRPVWVLLPYAPDWRWGLGREETPWYPTMRLYRQAAAGDWRAPIARLAADLAVQRGI